MQIRILVLLIVFSAVSMSISGCSGPKYLVDGLTLPSGSKEVSYNKTDGPPATPFPMPGAGEAKQTVVVQFSNSAGWDSVASHIDSCMRRAGYTESLDQLSNVGGAAMPKELGDLRNMMRSYMKIGGRYMVMLYNNNWAGALGNMTGMNSSGADFSLTIIEFKGD